MKTTLSFCEFSDYFRNSDTYKNNFTYNGLRALFDYFEDIEEETGTEIDFDMVAICCDYTEYENLEELKKNYNDIENFDDLEYVTTVIYTGDNRDENAPFIIQDF